MRTALGLVTSCLLFACGSVASTPDGAGDDVLPPDADPCATAACECTVATVDADCGPHSFCDVSGPGRSCACVAAYVDDGTGACVFGGAPADPGFQDPTAWTTSTNTSVIGGAAGSVDPGQGEVAAQGVCGLETIHQTFTMPPIDRADPMRLSITYKLIPGVFPDAFNTSTNVAVAVGGGWVELPTTVNAFRTETICLGAGAFGGPIDFRVSTFGPLTGTACTGAGKMVIDRMAVEVADPGECPAPGNVRDGSFEAAAPAWTLPTGTAVSGTFTNGIGEAGTRAARVTYTTICGQGPLTGQLSLPRDVNHKALDLFWSAPNGSKVQLTLDDHAIGTVVGTGATGHSRTCLPTWAAGTAPKVGVLMLAQSDGFSTCTVTSRSLIVDNVSIVDEPGCTSTAPLIDPSFELNGAGGSPVTPWGTADAYVNGARTGESDAIINLNLSHTGTGLLSTRAGNGCQDLDIAGGDVSFIVPASSGGGPAVKFFGKAAATNTNSDSAATIIRYAGIGGVGATPRQSFAIGPRVLLPETGTYVQGILCIPSTMIGRLVTVRLSTGRNGGGGCGEVFSETANWDDVDITTDPSCPP